MVEKILGFLRQDAEIVFDPEICVGGFKVREDKLVPVVSLEWLENKVKKGLTQRPNKIIKHHKIKGKDKRVFLKLGYRTALNDLLTAVLRQAKEGK